MKNDDTSNDDVSVAPDPDQPSGVYDLSDDSLSPEEVYKQILNMRDEPARATEADEVAVDLDSGNEGSGGEGTGGAWETKYKELNEKYMRALADLENMRKRQQKQMLDMHKFGHENAVREILPILDNLERAVAAAPAQPGDELAKFLEGTQMIVQQFFAALDRVHVKPIAALGLAFDPTVHEAIQEIAAAEHPAGTVVHELQKGFVLHDRILRPAKVVISGNQAVASAPADAPDDLN